MGTRGAPSHAFLLMDGIEHDFMITMEQRPVIGVDTLMMYSCYGLIVTSH